MKYIVASQWQAYSKMHFVNDARLTCDGWFYTFEIGLDVHPYHISFFYFIVQKYILTKRMYLSRVWKINVFYKWTWIKFLLTSFDAINRRRRFIPVCNIVIWHHSKMGFPTLNPFICIITISNFCSDGRYFAAHFRCIQFKFELLCEFEYRLDQTVMVVSIHFLVIRMFPN